MAVPLFSNSMVNQFPTLRDQFGSRVATLDRWDTFRTPGGFDSGLRFGGDRILDSLG